MDYSVYCHMDHYSDSGIDSDSYFQMGWNYMKVLGFWFLPGRYMDLHCLWLTSYLV